MNATVLRMLSTNSLAAFSAANTTAPLQKAQQPRLVRQQLSPTATPAASAKNAIPSQIPSVAPPRGSLLNISV